MSEWETSGKKNEWETSGGSWETSGDAPRSYAGRVFKEALPAVGNLGLDIIQSIPSGLRGASEAVGAFAGGASFEEAMGRGAEGFESSMEHLREDLPRFRGPKVEAMGETLGEGLEQGIWAVGMGAEYLETMAREPGRPEEPTA